MTNSMGLAKNIDLLSGEFWTVIKQRRLRMFYRQTRRYAVSAITAQKTFAPAHDRVNGGNGRDQGSSTASRH